MTEPLFTGADWNFDLLAKSLEAVEEIGKKELGMSLYPNQIEIISSEQMLDLYSSVAMPVMYNHWSFGKRLIKDQANYRKGNIGLAYEIVSNTSPAIAYLMEDNTMIMQLLVLAHASVGHNYCFANNYMFKQWTDAEGIVDYLIFAKKYITDCESRYGFDAVEKLLDSCHALQNLGVDKYKRPARLNPQQEEARLQERLDEWDRNQTEMWYTLDKRGRRGRPRATQLLEEPEDNVLYFIEKNSPILKPWQREIVRIVRKVAQYFYPQRFTKVLNEGIATFTHHWILNHLYDQGLITNGHMIEWMASHANVVYQPNYDSRHYSGINPYALGFAVFRDIQRMAVNPTEEDRIWFPKLVGTDWKSAMRAAATEYRDDSFISQWLSPKVARDMKLFGIVDNKTNSDIVVNAIHNEQTFVELRSQLAQQYDANAYDPNIQVVEADLKGTRTLTLQHRIVANRGLDKNTTVMLEHVKRLWGYPVTLRSVTSNDTVMQTHTAT